MAVATDYTSILYAADGQPNIAWNGMTTAGTPVIVTYSFVEVADLAAWEATTPYANDGYTSLTAAQRANFAMRWRFSRRRRGSSLSRRPAVRR